MAEHDVPGHDTDPPPPLSHSVPRREFLKASAAAARGLAWFKPTETSIPTTVGETYALLKPPTAGAFGRT
jgi:hypothetical protein